MKTIIKIFGLLVLFGLVVSSCDSDDDDNDRPNILTLPKYTTINIPLYGNADEKIESNEYEIELSDIIDFPKSDYISAQYVFSQSSVSVINLPTDSISLIVKDVTVTVDGQPAVNLGNCYAKLSDTDEGFEEQQEAIDNDKLFVTGLKYSKDTIQTHASLQYAKILEPLFDGIIPLTTEVPAESNRKSKVKISYTLSQDIPESLNLNFSIVITGVFEYYYYYK